jgi:ADP-ribose pyrophosphatase
MEQIRKAAGKCPGPNKRNGSRWLHEQQSSTTRQPFVYSVGMVNATRKNATQKKISRSSSPISSASPSRQKDARAAGKQKTVQVLSSRVVHTAPVFRVTSDEVIEPSGVKVRRDIIRHPGSVVILALDERKKEPSVLLIRQYRYAANQELWELPAGRIDPGEDALTAAKRELAEETGYSASEWKLALHYYSSPGFLDETMSLFAARDLLKGRATLEEDEFITCKLVPLGKAVQWVMSGKLKDGKAIAGVLWAAQEFPISGTGKISKRK